MLYGGFKKKPFLVLWFLLCIAISLSCLPHQSLVMSEGSYTADTPSTLHGDTARRSDLYPDLIHEYLAEGQSTFFLTRLSASHRIPLRLPMPHIWISFVLCAIAGLQLPVRYRIGKRSRILCIGSYIIRYIHDQDGETYHSFLF